MGKHNCSPKRDFELYDLEWNEYNGVLFITECHITQRHQLHEYYVLSFEYHEFNERKHVLIAVNQFLFTIHFSSMLEVSKYFANGIHRLQYFSL